MVEVSWFELAGVTPLRLPKGEAVVEFSANREERAPRGGGEGDAGGVGRQALGHRTSVENTQGTHVRNLCEMSLQRRALVPRVLISCQVYLSSCILVSE